MNFIRIAPAVLGLCLLCGCESLRGYNGEKHELAKTAKSSFTDAKLPDLAAQEYNENQRVLDRQLASVRRFDIAMRNAIIVQALDNHEDVPTKKAEYTWQFLLNQVTNRLNDLGALATNGFPLTSLADHLSELTRLEDKETKIRLAIKASSDTNFIDVQQNVVLPGILKRQSSTRADITNDLAKAGSGKPLASLFAEISALETNRVAMKGEAESWKTNYQAARTNFESANTKFQNDARQRSAIALLETASGILRSYDSTTNLDKASPTLTNQITALKSLAASPDADKVLSSNLLVAATNLLSTNGNSSSLADAINSGYKDASKTGNPIAFAWITREYLGQGAAALQTNKLSAAASTLRSLGLYTTVEKLGVQLAALDKLLAVFVNNQGTAPGMEKLDTATRTEFGVALTLRSLADLYMKTKSFPPPGSLLLASEHLRLELDAANKRLARADARAQLLNQKLQAMLREIDYLASAKESMDNLGSTNSIAEEYTSGNNDKKLLIAKTLYNYANSWTVGRSVEDEIDYRLIGLIQDSALDAESTALAECNNLILVPISHLEAYWATGLTTDQIANLLNTAGLAAIAARVK